MTGFKAVFWVLLVMLFAKDGSVLVIAKPDAFPSEQACRDSAAEVSKVVQANPPEGLAVLGFKCDGPLSNPVTAKGA